MGGGSSTARVQKDVQPAEEIDDGNKAKPAFSEQHAIKQMKRIDRVAPRKKLEMKNTMKINVDGEYIKLPYACVSQTGYYPDELDKLNQDALNVKENLGENDFSHGFFGVYDGHGKMGDYCSNYAKDELWENIEKNEHFRLGETHKAIHEAFVQTNKEMHQQESLGSFSDMMSGTTAITALFHRDNLFIANVGDSRAISICYDDNAKKYVPVPLSIDQTPFRKDERERVKKCGARVLTMAQLDGYVDPDIQDYGNEEDNDGDPPRLWTKMGSYPGTAFTRSLGDRVAEEIGVVAEPEILQRKITKHDKYILLASDGVFEFITSEGVVDIFSRYKNNIMNACKAIVSEAYRQWLQFETRTDDITCVIIDVQALGSMKITEDELKKRKGSFAVELLAEEIRKQAENGTGFENTLMGKMMAERKEAAAAGAYSSGGGGGGKAVQSFKLDSSFSLEKSSAGQFAGMELRPVRRKVANNVGVVPFDPAELLGYTLPVSEKPEEEKQRIRQAIQNNYLFAHLQAEQLETAVLAMEKVEVEKDQYIIKQFDKGDRFYVAASGSYVVEVAVNKTVTNHEGKQVTLHGEYEEPREVMEYIVEEGGVNPSFGELALMYNKPRAASIRAIKDGSLWSLERKAFHSILTRDSAHHLVRVLRKVKTFSTLSYNEIARLVDLLTEEHFKNGDVIVKQGDEGDSFYVIKKGQAIVTINDSESGEEKEVMKLTEYEYFGEKALINSAPRAANVVAIGDVTCLTIRKRLFDDVLGRLETVLKEEASRRESAAKNYYKVASLDQLRIFPGPIQFILGTGYRCELRKEEEQKSGENSQFGTLRRIKYPEDESEREEKKASIQRELEILKAVPCPTIISEFENPQNPLIHYQLLKEEFVIDIESLIAERPLDPSSRMIRYAVKSVASALLELQQHRGILCRGVAPEGIMLDIHGEPKLVDFRFAKITNGTRTFTTCGTPEYIAPEQIKGIGHGYPCDWWSLGILVCELCTGKTPFADQSEGKMYEMIADEKVIAEYMQQTLSPVFEPQALKFVNTLLTHDPERRLVIAHESEFQDIPFLSRIAGKESPFKTLSTNWAMKLMRKQDKEVSISSNMQ